MESRHRRVLCLPVVLLLAVGVGAQTMPAVEQEWLDVALKKLESTTPPIAAKVKDDNGSPIPTGPGIPVPKAVVQSQSPKAGSTTATATLTVAKEIKLPPLPGMTVSKLTGVLSKYKIGLQVVDKNNMGPPTVPLPSDASLPILKYLAAYDPVGTPASTSLDPGDGVAVGKIVSVLIERPYLPVFPWLIAAVAVIIGFLLGFVGGYLFALARLRRRSG